MARVPASKVTRKRLEQLFEGGGAAEADRGELVKLAARLIVEEALEEDGERPVLKLMYAALIRASQTWRRIVISEFELKQIEELRNDLEKDFRERTASAVQSASHQRIFSKRGT